jgi:hypothetical protein
MSEYLKHTIQGKEKMLNMAVQFLFSVCTWVIIPVTRDQWLPTSVHNDPQLT